MRGYKWYIIIFLAILVIAQPNFSNWISIKGAVISFVLFFVMLTAFGRKRPDIFIVALSIGFFYDMMYSPWLGRMTIILLLAVLSVMAVGKIVYKNNMPILTVFYFVSTYILENVRTVLEVGPRIYYKSFAFIQGGIFRISLYAATLAAVFGTVFFLQSFIRDRKLGARKNGVI